MSISLFPLNILSVFSSALDPVLPVLFESGAFNAFFGSLVMRKLIQKMVRFLHQEHGPTAVEYAVMLALIVVVCIAAITTLGSNANSTFGFVSGQIQPTAS